VAPQANQRGQAMQDLIIETRANAIGMFAERHYTVAEVAAMWNFSKDAVRRLFQKEPGVLVFSNPVRGSRRQYRTLRIPESVVERVHKLYSL
jgi:hypothetical protein